MKKNKFNLTIFEKGRLMNSEIASIVGGATSCTDQNGYLRLCHPLYDVLCYNFTNCKTTPTGENGYAFCNQDGTLHTCGNYRDILEVQEYFQSKF